MKKKLLFLLLLLLRYDSYAQEIVFVPSTYIGGYNVSCYGANDGAIQSIINMDGAPFTFQWSNGAYTSSISNISSGVYTLTVTNTYGVEISSSFEIIQPSQIQAAVYVSDFNGSNVSDHGASDGSITIEARGGGGNYSFLWNMGSVEPRINGLSAGVYSATITDENNCHITISRTLIEPQQLQITGVTKSNFSGSNISCFGGNNGWAEVQVIGGTTPYTYQWSSGSFSPLAEKLSAGNYTVKVIDANHVVAVANIIMDQPDQISVNLSKTSYQNGFNISCFNCANGGASLFAQGGKLPYNYYWSNGSVAQTISGLNKGEYEVTVFDNNGCSLKTAFSITQPEREDWSMNGNGNTNPVNQFLGTSDSTDFNIKVNNKELINFMANGEIKVGADSKLISNGPGALYLDSNGVFKSSSQSALAPCSGTIAPVWSSLGTSNLFSCPQLSVGIGDWNIPSGIGLYVNKVARFDQNVAIAGMPLGAAKLSVNGATIIGSPSFFSSVNNVLPVNGLLVEGNVRIGNNYANSDYKLAVSGKIVCEEVLVKLTGNWPDYVYSNNYSLMSINKLKKFIELNSHLPGFPSAIQINQNSTFKLGEMQKAMLEKLEEYSLYIIYLNEQNELLANQLRVLSEKLK